MTRGQHWREHRRTRLPQCVFGLWPGGASPVVRRVDVEAPLLVGHVAPDLGPGAVDVGEAVLDGELARAHRLLVSWTSGLDGVALVSDGYIPFRDNIDQASRHGVRYIAEPGGSARNHEVETACREHGIQHIRTRVRLFRH